MSRSSVWLSSGRRADQEGPIVEHLVLKVFRYFVLVVDSPVELNFIPKEA